MLLAAWYLRPRDHRVFTMGCSKFDDLPRKAWRDWLKSFSMVPSDQASARSAISASWASANGLSWWNVQGLQTAHKRSNV